MSRRKKLYDLADIPTGRWYPDRGERVFVGKFNTHAKVIEICPWIEPGDGVARDILYLVELESWGYKNKYYDFTKVELGTRTLVRTEDVAKSQWFPDLSLPLDVQEPEPSE